MSILMIILICLVSFLIYRNETSKKHSSKPLSSEPHSSEPQQEAEDNSKSYSYTKKPLLTEMEKKFFVAIKKSTGENYTVQPQVNLATIIQKQGEFKYQNELYRNIDFCIFNKNYECILLIEINDESHNEPSRKRRDAKVKEICKAADIPLITFYTKYGVNQKYIDEKIKQNIK